MGKSGHGPEGGAGGGALKGAACLRAQTQAGRWEEATAGDFKLLLSSNSCR